MLPAIQRIELSLRDQFLKKGVMSVEDSPIVLVAISEKADSDSREMAMAYRIMPD